MTRSLPLAIETSQAVTIEELSRTPESSFATDSSNTWEAQPAETQSDDLDKLEQEIRQNSILLNKLHQIDVENNKFMNEQMLKNRIPVDVEEGEQMEADDHSSQDGSLEAIQLSQWRTISRTFAEGEFDVVLGIVSAVLMFILVLLVFLIKCRSRVADQSAQEEKQQQFVEDAERGMLHRPEQVLRAVDMQTMQTMHV